MLQCELIFMSSPSIYKMLSIRGVIAWSGLGYEYDHGLAVCFLFEIFIVYGRTCLCFFFDGLLAPRGTSSGSSVDLR
jgi:hypothetical protein